LLFLSFVFFLVEYFYFIFVARIWKLQDKNLYLSVQNEGFKERIRTLRKALSVMRRKFDSAEKKYKILIRIHSKCPEKRKIMFLHR
jgi:hypothetical protein